MAGSLAVHNPAALPPAAHRHAPALRQAEPATAFSADATAAPPLPARRTEEPLSELADHQLVEVPVKPASAVRIGPAARPTASK
ncbi:hypothetical protein ACFVGY_18775 [Streptomyces sp. NPDC127106]|uniref:hypothetical protein n=1 Tax=Streptomyces sp. NPDC127106 TaxID=3345360 RepID=UPI003625EBE0